MPELKKLCLNMIVKNEDDNLPILFASLHEVIDYYVICDTGSEDRTVEVINEEMDKYGIPGEIHHDKWVNFGHNRQLALDRAVGKSKYVLIIDADEELEYNDKDFPNKLVNSGYTVIKRDKNSISYPVTHILNIENNNQFGWKWYAPVHEYLSATNSSKVPNYNIGNLHDIIIHRYKLGIGGRSKGLTDKEKYLKDAVMFEEELLKNPTDTRSQFYLAQSYKDAHEPEKSIENYYKRIKLGGWTEEVYYSYLMIAQQLKTLQKPPEEWILVYLEAYDCLPTRKEAVCFLVDHYRTSGKHNLGHMIGKATARLPKPTTGLFMFDSIYDYSLYDSYSVCAYWAGDYEDCIYFCQKLLYEGKIPAEHISRVKQNLDFALRKLNK